MRFFATAILAAAIWLSPTEVMSDQATLTIVADEWPPFSGQDLPNKGMSLDVISTVLERAGYEVETAVLPWARIMAMTAANDVDIVGSLFFDPTMTKHVTYAEPFYETDVRLVRRIGSDHQFEGVKELMPFAIAVGAGFLYQDEFDKAEYLNKIEVTTTLQGMQMLAAGRVDLTLDSSDVINHVLRHDDPSLAGKIELAPGALVTQQIHMAVGNSVEGRDKIVADFNRTLAEMRLDGSLADLVRVHTGE